MTLEREREAAEEDEDEVEKRSRQPFTFAFNVLAVCAGGGHLKRRHVVRLLEMASNQQSPDGMTHSIGIHLTSFLLSFFTSTNGYYSFNKKSYWLPTVFGLFVFFIMIPANTIRF